MSGSNKYWNLLHKKLTGSLQEVEQEQLKQWIGNDETNRRSARAVEKAWELSSSYKSSYEPDVNAGFNRFKKRIAVEQQTASKQLEVIHRRTFGQMLLRIAAAILLTAGAAYLYTSYTSNNNWTYAGTGIGQTEKVELPDGTIVWINEETVLEFPQQFPNHQRFVKLRGEAFFDVSRDETRPFLIETNHTVVEVLGTSFNVRALNQESFTEVVVKTGKVQFKGKSNENAAVILEANEKAVFNHLTKNMQNQKSAALNEMAWQTSRLSFRDTKMSEVFSTLERQFKVKIKVTEPSMLKCEFTSLFPGAKLENILVFIETTNSWKMSKIDSTTYQFSGDGCE